LRRNADVRRGNRSTSLRADDSHEEVGWWTRAAGGPVIIITGAMSRMDMEKVDMCLRRDSERVELSWLNRLLL
jgi:hypothetical protein